MTIKAISAHLSLIGSALAVGCVALFAAPAFSMAETVRIVGFGDSLMEGYQLPSEAAFPVRLEEALRAKGYDVSIANAGLPGDTTSGGRERLDWSVEDGTDGVILELGANDALRGISPERTEENLRMMIERLQERDIAILLAGMMAPPNMGSDYAERFNGIYERLADEYDLALYPFFLDGVAAEPGLNLDDGMHPNEAGVDVMVERFLPAAEAFLTDLGAEQTQ